MSDLRKMKMVWADDLFGQSNDPCAVCGRGLKKGGQVFSVHVIDGGANVLHPDSEADYVEDAGEMGFHKVGPECRKRFGDFAVKGGGPV